MQSVSPAAAAGPGAAHFANCLSGEYLRLGLREAHADTSSSALAAAARAQAGPGAGRRAQAAVAKLEAVMRKAAVAQTTFSGAHLPSLLQGKVFAWAAEYWLAQGQGSFITVGTGVSGGTPQVRDRLLVPSKYSESLRHLL